MNVLDHIRLVVYRIHEKGLEILMIDPLEEGYKLPEVSLAQLTQDELEASGKIIMLDDEASIRTLAIEGDWHDIPSIRGLIKKDMELVKSKMIEVIPEIEQGTYVAVKEVFKKVLPREYAAIKELKDVLMTRNMLRNL